MRIIQSPVPVVGRWARAAVGDVVAAVFPADCRGCDGPLLGVSISHVSIPLCDQCLSRIAGQSESNSYGPMVLCGCCGEALDMEGLRYVGAHLPPEGLLCAECRMVPPDFTRAVAYGLYEYELREMVHLLKYERVRAVARPLGSRLATAIRMLQGVAAEEIVVVPVPLFAAKEKARGYNQATLLAESALAELKKSDPAWKLHLEHDLLRRTRDTESQFALTPKQRRVNLRGAFEVATGIRVAGREVLLLDDIYTTGATARECARVLRLAGAVKVWVATATRAQPEMVALWGSSAAEV